MRLAAQAKMGYYPAPLPAVDLALARLVPPAGGPVVLDPCAGEGMALAYLAQELDCKPAAVHAIELDAYRADQCRERLPGANVLGPASFFGCAVTPRRFGLVWLNPPFDDALGGGRTEADFLKAALHMLPPKGVLGLVCPAHVVRHYSMEWALVRDFENITVLEFPADHRRFDEVIVLATRRKQPLEHYHNAWDESQAPEGFVYQYHIPATDKPPRFEKVELTDDELLAALAGSPLTKEFLSEPAPRPLASPPMSLGTGHIALLLSSGYLDGLVKPKRGKAHVVRGTARKTEYVSGYTETEDEDGGVNSTTTISEKIQLIVRVALEDGTILTLNEKGGDDEQRQ